MKKQIPVSDLEVGMFICRFNGHWLDNPFWRSEILLQSAQELQLLQASNVQSVWVDFDKSTVAYKKSRHNSLGNDEYPPQELPEQSLEQRQCPTPLGEEMQHAALIIEKSKKAVVQMFTETRMGAAIDVEIARAVAEEITDSVMRNSRALISLARFKTANDYTYMHSVAVCALMAALARQLKLSQDEILQAALAGLMHDIGKAEIPLEILDKPGKLSSQEFGVMQQHPQRGLEILKRIGVPNEAVLDVCLHHHERMDGTGYPYKLPGHALSIMARMGAICDIYDAITSNRPYKHGWEPSDSLQRMAQWCGSHLDTQIFHAFVKTLGIYPIGTLVRLSGDLLAVVIGQNAETLLKPVVKIFFCAKTGAPIPAHIADLAADGCEHKILQREDPAAWHLGDWSRLWGEHLEGVGEAALA